MKILEYTGLDTRGLVGSIAKVSAALAAGDFHAAQVKKLVGNGDGRYYRARLDDSNRLLFTLVRYADQTCIVLLEVIRNHAYDRSRFLRGAQVDESRIVDATRDEAERGALPLRYLHPERGQIHLLDKPISFDDAQQQVFQQAAPLIVVGSAGSGKTALTLEKLKQAEGDVLYVTHSAFLAQSAREQYYAHGFEAAKQDAGFLSYREFLETLLVPAGQEADWPRFADWFRRMQQAFRGIDAHQAFEEIRGVITAGAEGPLQRDAYLALGVRQSIFADEQRDVLYDLFGKYREWLRDAALYDLNLLAHERLPLAQPRYDFIVIDEVQDMTPVQLALALKTLRRPGQFLLCGDSNQIVHPNFFSWSQVKTLFWRDAELAEKQQLRVLSANFRNAACTTRIANTLLKIKHRRFGSIDRESNFLVQAIGAEPGQASLIPDRETLTRELDRQTRGSTQVAVLVLRDEDKPAARLRFGTPLLFSVHEAKGLEYENIVLYRFVSDHRGEFAEICDGVDSDDLLDEHLEYRRARDKSDKSLEVYKFYVNALYVALTRAVKNLYLVESDTSHPLFRLLDIGADESAKVQARTASREDWQREARRLELQGKQEQAEAIRRDKLQQAVPPWPVFDEPRLRETLVRVFRDQVPSTKQRQQLFEQAAILDAPALANFLAEELKFASIMAFYSQRHAIARMSVSGFGAKNIKEVMSQCQRYGTEHRTPSNQTPLMAAAAVGNLPLIDALLEAGADPDAVDHFGQNALHCGLRAAFDEPEFARGSLAAVFDRLAPSSIDLQAGQRLLRIDRQKSEYLLLQTMWVLFRSQCTHFGQTADVAFDTHAVLHAWRALPSSVLRPERNRRAHVSALLSRNEVSRDYAYNRALFRRIAHGWYQFDPALSVRVREAGSERWVPILQRLNLPLAFELAAPLNWSGVRELAARGGIELPMAPIAGERQFARQQQEIEQWREQQRQLDEARAAAAPPPLRQRRMPAAAEALRDTAGSGQEGPEPPWGSPAARQRALQREIERVTALRQARAATDTPED